MLLHWAFTLRIVPKKRLKKEKYTEGEVAGEKAAGAGWGLEKLLGGPSTHKERCWRGGELKRQQKLQCRNAIHGRNGGSERDTKQLSSLRRISTRKNRTLKGWYGANEVKKDCYQLLPSGKAAKLEANPSRWSGSARSRTRGVYCPQLSWCGNPPLPEARKT